MATRSKRSTRRDAKPKAQYRVQNWHDYDRALVARGDLTLWFDGDALETLWYSEHLHKAGRPFTYSDTAIQTVLTLKAVFHMTNRSAEGFTRSLMRKLGYDLPTPDHTILSRRARTLTVAIARRMPERGLHLVIDSTGLKVFGEGEWKVRQHGYAKRRTWRKVHLGVDAAPAPTRGATGQILAVEMTGSGGADCDSFSPLLEQLDEVTSPVEQVSADGGYDKRKVYDALEERGITAAIPPREDAALWEEGHARNAAVEQIRREGFQAWAESVGYYARARAENTMYRLKQLLGASLSPRDPDRQVCEVHVRVACLNIMTGIGMPRSVRIMPAA
ncbi:MAG TPA: IS5 family transposase [Rhodothermales bacterium]|nr:IS5 family transposase [Rhodothermales bacterium]